MNALQVAMLASADPKPYLRKFPFGYYTDSSDNFRGSSEDAATHLRDILADIDQDKHRKLIKLDKLMNWGECSVNAQSLVDKQGGKAVYGWAVHCYPERIVTGDGFVDDGIEVRYHCVYQNPQGELIETCEPGDFYFVEGHTLANIPKGMMNAAGFALHSSGENASEALRNLVSQSLMSGRGMIRLVPFLLIGSLSRKVAAPAVWKEAPKQAPRRFKERKPKRK